MIIKVGADPEVFVRQNGVFRSAHGLIEGTKQNPHPVEKGAVQVDGMALEFNIDPATTQKDWLFNISTVMRQLEAMVPEHDIAITSTADFGAAYIAQQPEEARILGCEPDFNAYTEAINPAPDVTQPFRTAAGHVHIGWTKNADITSPQHLYLCRTLIKQLDCFLGLPSKIFDGDGRRRQLYGKAGAFRPKPYGVEYRVLSNKWLQTQELQRWVYRGVKNAIKDLKRGRNCFQQHDISNIFNNQGIGSAREYIRHYQANGYEIEVPDVR